MFKSRHDFEKESAQKEADGGGKEREQGKRGREDAVPLEDFSVRKTTNQFEKNIELFSRHPKWP